MSYSEYVDLSPDDPLWGHGYASTKSGLRLHYVRKGKGKPVVLLHGWPGFWYDWRRIIPPLSSETDVLAPDYRGFGDSDKPEGEPRETYSREILAQDIGELFNSLSIDNAVLVGFDIGAAVAQIMARNSPDRVAALALFNPPYPGIGTRRFDPSHQRHLWYQHFHTLDWAHELVGYNRETVRIYLRYFFSHWVGRKEAIRSAEFDAIVDKFARSGALKSSFAYYKGLAEIRIKEAKEADPAKFRIRQPTSVLWGDSDPLLKAEWADRLPEYFEDATVKILPGVGHFVALEAPEDTLTAIREAVSRSGQ
jgi:pimeloyl-ACP methyl ester carboxylesterase